MRKEMAYLIAPNAVEGSDIEMKYNTFIDEVSLPFLEEAEIDYVTEELGRNWP